MGIYIDLTKAFDLVNHDILVGKLQTYGVRGHVLTLVKSYLSNRQQYTKVKGEISDIATVSCGVPQGSVLGPLFFLIFINDIQNCTSEDIRLFADDTNIFIVDKEPPKIRQRADRCMCNIVEWLNSNKILLSEGKTNFSVFTGTNTEVPAILENISVNGKSIKRTTSCKYLGLILDDKLIFDCHISKLCKDLLKIVSSFKIIKHWVPNNQKMKLYYAYFHSRVQFGLEIYGTAAKRHINKLEILQHKALKTLFNLDPLHPSLDLLKKFNILSIHDLYQERVAKFVYMQKSGKLPGIFSSYFVSNENRTYPRTRNRGKLILPRVRTENAKKSMKYRGVMIWNRLFRLTKININKPYHCYHKQIKEWLLASY